MDKFAQIGSRRRIKLVTPPTLFYDWAMKCHTSNYSELRSKKMFIKRPSSGLQTRNKKHLVRIDTDLQSRMMPELRSPHPPLKTLVRRGWFFCSIFWLIIIPYDYLNKFFSTQWRIKWQKFDMKGNCADSCCTVFESHIDHSYPVKCLNLWMTPKTHLFNVDGDVSWLYRLTYTAITFRCNGQILIVFGAPKLKVISLKVIFLATRSLINHEYFHALS